MAHCGYDVMSPSLSGSPVAKLYIRSLIRIKENEVMGGRASFQPLLNSAICTRMNRAKRRFSVGTEMLVRLPSPSLLALMSGRALFQPLWDYQICTRMNRAERRFSVVTADKDVSPCLHPCSPIQVSRITWSLPPWHSWHFKFQITCVRA